MISAKEYCFQWGIEALQQDINYATRVRPPIDIVAQSHHDGALGRIFLHVAFYRVTETLYQIGAAVDISKSVNAGAIRHLRRGRWMRVMGSLLPRRDVFQPLSSPPRGREKGHFRLTLTSYLDGCAATDSATARPQSLFATSPVQKLESPRVLAPYRLTVDASRRTPLYS